MQINTFIKKAIVSAFVLCSFVKAQDGIVELEIYDSKTGESVQTQKGYSTAYWHGFDILHKQGINGEGSVIAFIEHGVHPKHPQFKEGQITVFDCSQHEKPHGVNRAVMRVTADSQKRGFFYINIPHISRSHATHVMGVALGLPMKVDNTSNHFPILISDRFPPNMQEDSSQSPTPVRYVGDLPGGCCPNAQGILYTFSDFSIVSPNNAFLPNPGFHIHPEMGAALFSLKEYIDLELYSPGSVPSLKNRYSKLSPPLNEQERKVFDKEPVDGSLLTAFREALKGPAFAISCSFKPFQIMDPTRNNRVPDSILNELADLAENHDKIIIWGAGNDEQCLEESTDDKTIITMFFKQILDHPILSTRTLIALNACPATEDDTGKLEELAIRGNKIPIRLHPSSNYPGEQLKSLCLSVIGSYIISGNEENDFKRLSGTSQAAPILASLATVIRREAERQGLFLTGPAVIKRMKEKAIKLNDSRFGNGYVWAPAALDFKEE